MDEIRNQNEQGRHERFFDPFGAAAVITYRSYMNLVALFLFDNETNNP